MRVIGCDPDSDKYGIAVYQSGKLVELHNLTVMGLCLLLSQGADLFVTEHVMGNRSLYARNNVGSRAVAGKISQNIGQCKQAQKVAEEMAAHFGIPIERVKPTRQNWAKDRGRFERITGWKGRSNDDTRSAAYFGFLYANKV